MSRQTWNFPTDEILSVMTSRKLCENHDGVIFLMDFLLGCELPKGTHEAALPKVAALIAEQLEWVRGAEKSFEHFQGEPCDWLKMQIAEHGESHWLLGPHPSKSSELPESWDPMPSVKVMDPAKKMTMEERHAPYVDAAKRCQLDWGDVNDINSEAVEAVGALMRLSVGGYESAIEMLRDLAVSITRHLHAHHSESMEHAQEFPAVLSAGNEQRQQELDAYKALPIGKLVGFPHRPGKKPGTSYDNSPAGFWRETQFWLDAVRRLIQAARRDPSSIFNGEGLPFDVSPPLVEKIAALQDFGGEDKSEWLGVALQFVAENPCMVPDWISVRAANSETGRSSLSRSILTAGFGYCWPR